MQVDDDACLTKDEQPGPDNKPKLAVSFVRLGSMRSDFVTKPLVVSRSPYHLHLFRS